ncbi:helix-turn-helix domain-containing protein [uncultured Flavobacterium sp.]|uniref:helix-turn-helix domain-containing protein n=1 Tax=uncultured Flavobacterium sp. TaxID=165435 RepID=UPI0025CC9045|nr:helix-turn-helix domain-containing protein [uncultured Flavobacterium sp.]
MKPKAGIVSKYIDHYYFHSSNDNSFSSKFTFYPNYKHAITIYKGSDVRFTANASIIRQSGHECIGCYYSINTHRSFSVDLGGKFDKIGIVFHPLGLNHFIGKPLSEAFEPAFGPFDYFGKALHDVVSQISLLEDANAKAALLDAFFGDAYCGFGETAVKRAVQEILNSNGIIKVEELSETVDVNRKTLLRLFKKHLCCSIEAYKKMVMFRNALNYSQQAGEDATLTDVALYSYYYDQAHYIKHFKSVTMHSPKTVLSKLTHLGDQGVYWNFEG